MDLDQKDKKMSAATESKPSGYDSTKTRVKKETIEAFVTGPNCGSIGILVGVGPVNMKKFKEQNIHTIQQLMGIFMTLANTEKITPTAHKHLMYAKLVELGINHSRSDMVDAMAEKIAVIFPEFYDYSE